MTDRVTRFDDPVMLPSSGTRLAVIARRATCASLEPRIDLEIDRRLDDLDAYDTALHELSA